ncbi:hypothetical protein SAMN05421837_112250 [Amycolatopsis pretoriensis]|uniref:Proteins of 100 residues with WXG n=1 Tax=Amycolatopsis pretoriensis TaxID=218821 RepID=A0A1H5RHX5_9PSEU|nr:hypothetical protein [Amycolatopsis pretoriensis]SEF37137.1 hypothetical protein SAMN05421837_112250 [Amycolatopsis pretoriensis]
MADWKTDDEVRSAADRAARRLIDLFDDEQPDGKWLGSPETYPNGGGAVLLRGLLDDAGKVISLDPQKIIDEFERMKKVGRALDQDTSTDIIDAFRTIDYSVQDWEGGGADAFRHQISMIQAFLGQQASYLVKTVESLAILLAASVQARRDYIAAADATSAAVAKALQQHADADTKIAISVSASVVSAVLGVATGGAWFTASAGVVIGASSAGLQLAVDGDKFAEVAAGYKTAKDQVLTTYQDVIETALGRVQDAERDLLGEKNELFAPMPPSITVASPSFHYGDFSSGDRPVVEFDPKVDQEHRKLIDQHGPAGLTDPATPIQRRLDG